MTRFAAWAALLLGSLIFILPLIGNQLGLDLNVVGWLLSEPVGWLVELVIRVTGNG